MIIVGSSLRVILSIGQDIGAGATAQIKFSNPSTSGIWTATIDDTATGQVHYDMTPGELDTLGMWSVWAVYTLLDGSVWKTPAKQFTVYAEGTAER